MARTLSPKLALVGLVALLLVLALLMRRPILMGIGRLLVVDETPVPSDVVVVAGGHHIRLAYGIELVKAGIAPRLLVTFNKEECPAFWAVDCMGLMKERLRAGGLRDDQVLLVDRAHSTYSEATLTRQRLEASGLGSAVIVSAPYHMRRLSWTWRHVFDGSKVRLTFDAVPFERFGMSLDGWWLKERELIFVFEEYIKLCFYWTKGYL